MNSNGERHDDIDICECTDPNTTEAVTPEGNGLDLDVCVDCGGIVEPGREKNGKWCSCLRHNREVVLAMGDDSVPYGHYKCNNCGKPIQ